MTIRCALSASLLCAILACTGSRERRVLSTSGHGEQQSPSDIQANAPVGAADGTLAERTPQVSAAASSARVANAPAPAPPATENVARALLAERFREAGYRILYDVTVREPGRFEFTVDGYDPVSQVGYEYIAESERETDLLAAERRALGADRNYRILVLDAVPADALIEPVSRFLAGLPASR